MSNPPLRQHRWARAVGTSLALLVTVQLPNTAGIPTVGPIPIPKFDLFHRLEPHGKIRSPKVNFGYNDAWVAKYQVGPGGVRKVLWKRQLGSSRGDQSRGVATDKSGNVFIAGFTNGSLGGAGKGDEDAWIAKYSSDGTLLWTKQLGTSGPDYAKGIATDRHGNVFITGDTYGSLGGTSRGAEDAWIAKYSPDGTLMWTKQLGTPQFDLCWGISTDNNGNVFITGDTEGILEGTNQRGHDAWVVKYNPYGILKWKRQLGTSFWDRSQDVATDRNGNVLITGLTAGALGGSNQGGYDAWVAKYNPDGTLVWTKQLGTPEFDLSQGIATDRYDNVFITGYTSGLLGGTNQGLSDAWVAKYTSDGGLKWKRQLGSSSYEDSYSAATDSSGNVFIAGLTYGSLGGTKYGGIDAWVAKFSSHGKQLWLRQDGVDGVRDYITAATGVAVDSDDYVIVTGYSDGNFSGD